MPKTREKKGKEAIELEGKLEIAISDLKSGKIPSLRRAAAIYGVPFSTLQRRYRGSQRKAVNNIKKQKLTPSEEETLIRWILSIDKRGFPPRPSTAAEMANILLSNRGSSHTTKRVGKNWVSTFIQRHPELKTCFSRRYNYQRAKCEDRTIISEWFDRVK